MINLSQITTLSKEELHNIVEGDVVERMLAARVPCYFIVTRISEDFIFCGPWTFDRNTGMEVDSDLTPGYISHISKVLTEEDKKNLKEKELKEV